MSTIPRLIRLSIWMAAIASAVLGSHLPEQSLSAPVVGSVHFPTSCSKQAQEHVEHGLAMFHSFLFEDAENQFNLASDADPTCAITYWARAIGLYRPLAYLPTDADMKNGWDLVQRASQLTPKTQRERGYLQAAEILYRPDARNYSTRNHEYSAAMGKISKTYPDDTEASVLYALSLLTFVDSAHPIQDSEKAIARF
jgi:hypothetical protein